MFRVDCRHLRSWQRPAIDLAIWCQRKRIHGYKSAGDHVLGQALPQICFQFDMVELFPRLGHYIADQPAIAGILFTNNHTRLMHRRMLGQYSFDFAQLDAEATNLHLVINSSEKFDFAIGSIAH